MKLYVGVTDKTWYEHVSKGGFDEVNFWKPGASTFKALAENEMFLFKLHSPDNFIVGGGFFVKFSILPTYMAWDAFGNKNGTNSLNELEQQINKYRSRNNMAMVNPQIGCIILTDPFFFERKDWIPVPNDWAGSIVAGKTYDTVTSTGKQLYEDVTAHLRLSDSASLFREDSIGSETRYSESMTKHRLGQGAFRVLVADSYSRRCAITGEKTLPVLDAAHIKSYSEGGQNIIQNGLLLRTDIHKLFDQGYVTVDEDYRVEVSHRLHEDYGNGKIYYNYHGKPLTVMPENSMDLPDKEYLRWHNENVYLG